jgi:glycosyltransferase involved in cell wall biosynthesis
MKIVAGIPAFNEENNIAKIITKLAEFVDIIIVCDDGSTDMTGKISEKLGAIVIKHEKNLGNGVANRSLFLKARELDCDILVTLDGDGQHRVEDLPIIIKPILDGESDIVIGSRFVGEKSDIPSYRKTGIKIINNLTNIGLEKKLKDTQSGYRAYSKKVIKEITPSESGMGVSTEILIKADKKGFKIAEVPIKILYEGDTSTHDPVSHGLSVIMSTMKFISIEHPLKFYGIPGSLFLAVGLFFLVWTLQLFAETRQIVTNISIIAVGTIIFGAMLMMTAIILYSVVSVIREKS